MVERKIKSIGISQLVQITWNLNVSINKVLLQHGYTPSFSYSPWLFLCCNEEVESRWLTACGLQSLKHLLSGSLPREFANSWLKWSRICLLDDLASGVTVEYIGQMPAQTRATGRHDFCVLELFKASVIQTVPSSFPQIAHCTSGSLSSPEKIFTRPLNGEKVTDKIVSLLLKDHRQALSAPQCLSGV